MVKPTLAELSKNNRYNRYTLVMAASKGARYVIDRDNYEKEHPSIAEYKAITGSAKKNDKGEVKPVMEAIDMLYNGDIRIKVKNASGDAEDMALSSSDMEMLAENEKESVND